MTLALALAAILVQQPPATPSPEQAAATDRLTCQVAAAVLTAKPVFLRPPDLERLIENAVRHDQAVRLGEDWPVGTAAALTRLNATPEQIEAFKAGATQQANAATDAQVAGVFNECLARFGASSHDYVYEGDEDGW